MQAKKGSLSSLADSGNLSDMNEGVEQPLADTGADNERQTEIAPRDGERPDTEGGTDGNASEADDQEDNIGSDDSDGDEDLAAAISPPSQSALTQSHHDTDSLNGPSLSADVQHPSADSLGMTLHSSFFFSKT